ncbi:agmatine deiminase family protein [Burkholderia contaminans]|uniref:agmatine deiminase family protein n=1 Tax=Burkholderia contaminans TaxID=488447 RepID=UPI0021AB79FB|nr:agmatine deiminase family protein [Burkholderia contaminans]
MAAGLDTDPSSYDHAVTRQHLEILRKSTDAKGRPLKVVVLPGPKSVRDQYENEAFAAGYIKLYVCSGAVIAPAFGDSRADRNTRDTLVDLFPGREIIQLNIDVIAAGGGIHCSTREVPA